MEEIERSAGSVEEAIEAALAELGISEQEAHVEILQEPRGGFLGIASQPAIVRVRRDAGQEAEGADESEDQAELAATFLEGLLDVIRTMGKYWLEIVELPENGDDPAR